jgi:anti-sigma B factor antagonist
LPEGSQARPPAVVTLPTEIDATNNGHVRELLEGAGAPGITVIADLTGTTFCDSAGFRVLTRAHLDATARGVQLRFAVTAGGVVSRMLRLLDLDHLLSVYPSLDAALKAEPGRNDQDQE